MIKLDQSDSESNNATNILSYLKVSLMIVFK